MQLITTCFAEGECIPDEFAFCAPDPAHHVCLGKNLNPELTWKDAPAGTRSFALICHDPDVPSKGDDVNQEGRTVPANLPRIDFFHWILVDIPADQTGISKGEYCQGVTPRGKSGPTAKHGTRQGINSYTNWFANDNDMRGEYFGYDGPCPPWNDERIHRYIFTLYALDTVRLPLEGHFDGQQALDAIKGHVLASASILGTYSLNPAIK